MSVLVEMYQENVRVNITWASLSKSHMSALASRRSVHTAPAPARVLIEESKESQMKIVIKYAKNVILPSWDIYINAMTMTSYISFLVVHPRHQLILLFVVL